MSFWLRGRASLARCKWIAGLCGALALPTISPLAAEHPVLTKQELAARYPGVSIDDLRDSVVTGFYEVSVGGHIAYVSVDARYLFRGEVVDLANNTNLTAKSLAADHAKLLATIDPSTEIVFSPSSGEIKHRITVFTDVDCGYCRQLHREIAETNALGIEVRYVSYPRTGPDTESWARAEGVWCSSDRKTMLTQAKLGADVSTTAECKAPVGEHYALGQRLGVSGTPAVYTESGVEIGGYLTPHELLATLERLAHPP